MKKQFIYLVSLYFLIHNYSFSQITIPDLSSQSTLIQHIGLDDIKVTYSRPSVKNRQIFGGIVPYNEIWRTGANGATLISLPVNIKINNTPIPSGLYSIFTIPGKDEWIVIFNKNTSLRGVSKYSQQEDILRFKVKPINLKDKVESFEIRFQNIKNDSAKMQLAWDNVMIEFPISQAIDSRIMAAIKKNIIDSHCLESQPYYRASIYYLDNNKDLQQAYQWIKKAISIDSSYIYFETRAIIESKLLLKQEAKISVLTGIERVKKENPNNINFIKKMEGLLKNL
ncbi:MAG: DUF2911 domain-containing protein [Chitinophagaceae bacterium]